MDGKRILLTGASSGVGLATTERLARGGASLVLVARGEVALEEAAERARALGAVAHALPADLADRDAATAAGEAIAEAHPDTTLLINNAGIALAGRFDQCDADQFDTVMAVNFHAVVTMTRALLPALTSHPGSHLVALSSIFGIIGPPGQTAYCASKFAVRGFLESLRGELAPAGVGVTCVHPGGVDTNIARNAVVGTRLPAAQWEAGRESFSRMLTMDPADAAATILRAVHRRRPRVLVGRDAVVLEKLARLFPVNNGRVLAAVTRRAARR